MQNLDINKLKIISDSLYFLLHGNTGQYIGLYKLDVLNEIWNCIAKHQIKKAFVFLILMMIIHGLMRLYFNPINV